jgi:hypothetical protein
MARDAQIQRFAQELCEHLLSELRPPLAPGLSAAIHDTRQPAPRFLQWPVLFGVGGRVRFRVRLLGNDGLRG